MTEVAVALIWEGGKFMICQRPARMFSGLSIVGFQFSPPRGGRRTGKCWTTSRCANFNSRPRVGGRLYEIDARMAGLIISILAPAWGASAHSHESEPQFMYNMTKIEVKMKCPSFAHIHDI